MTPFASVAVFKRGGRLSFRPSRKERATDTTQARKAAIRFWRGAITGDDELRRVMLVREVAGRLEISERGAAKGVERPWTVHTVDFATAAREPHLAACMGELDIDAADAPPPMPDILIINGITYRREI